MSLADDVALMGDEAGVVYAVHPEKLLHKTGLALLEPQFQRQLDAVPLGGLALEPGIRQLFDHLLDLGGGRLVVVDDQQVGRAGFALEGAEQQDKDADDYARDDGYVVKLGADGDAFAHRPEHEHRVHGVFHGGAEADDGQGAHHAQAQGQVVVDEHEHQGGDQCQHHQACVKVSGVHDAAEALFVDEEDVESHHQGDGQGQDHLQGAQCDGKKVAEI